MRYAAMVSVLALMVAACGGSGDKSDQTPASAAASEEAGPLASTDEPSQAPSAPAREEKEENDTYSFAYSYPGVAAAIPGLKAILDHELDTDRENLVSSARSGKQEAEKDGYPYHAYERQTEWKVVADLPGWLSLSSTHYEYSGGAHGMTVSDTLLWDRGAETSRKPMDLFTSQDALRAAVRGPFCAALDKAREQKRGAPVQQGTGDSFSECIDPTAQTLILGSSDKHSFNRIGFLIAPYEAGPYAEGSYEVTLPVTGKIMAALKPQYRNAFSVKP
ncbi:PdaC/SigV domain-containing protein [Novosphingobium resinovorum]|uniref:PdaC/SigV domain-containing protein n=1 Tax=Novosphingobium resinovorum TaxID=158500 RepID=UPI002ED45EDF|nr:DUF4163 domain-containing protein [Novosphingobium resinovorum]